MEKLESKAFHGLDRIAECLVGQEIVRVLDDHCDKVFAQLGLGIRDLVEHDGYGSYKILAIPVSFRTSLEFFKSGMHERPNIVFDRHHIYQGVDLEMVLRAFRYYRACYQIF